MSLFVINRYQGEEQENEQENEPENESSHLSELLKRIEERKKQRALGIELKNTEPQTQSKPKKRKNKKRKVSDETLNNIPQTENGDQQNEESLQISENVVATKAKKKKKKKNLPENEINLNDGCVDEELIGKHDITSESTKNDIDQKTEDEEQNYVVLGAKTTKKQKRVQRRLPYWLAHPEIISADLRSGPKLKKLESVLDSELIRILKVNGIKRLFPVQASIVSWLLKCNNDRKLGWWPRDTCVSAPTGSGKTLAYVLPIVQELQHRLVPKIRCLVVLPVQELAAQVHKVMITYTAHTSLKVGLITGASSFEVEQSNIIKKTDRGEYRSTVDIVIATPGRLIDHLLKTSGFSLDALRFLVIDEADRATDWLQSLPEPHSRAPYLTLANKRSSKIPPAQKLLFSATLSQDPEKLSRLGLFQPILFTSVTTTCDDDVDLDKEVGNFVGRYTSPKELVELAVECPAIYKPVALYQLLTRTETVPKTLVFTNSGEAAHRLSILMQSILSEKNITIGELSAQLNPKHRDDILHKFITADIHVLVSSDALARGLDIPDVQLVVSYDLPKHIKGYIHRAGRTGRAGKQGTAISILTSQQTGIFKHMLTNAHKVVPTIENMELDDLADTINYQQHVETLRDTLEEMKHKHVQRLKAMKRPYKKNNNN